jgi:hypothetical protein
VECTPNLARKLGAIHDVGAAWEDEEQKLRMGSKMAIALLIVVTVVCQHLSRDLSRELIAVARTLLSPLDFSLIPLTISLRAVTLAKNFLASSSCQS